MPDGSGRVGSSPKFRRKLVSSGDGACLSAALPSRKSAARFVVGSAVGGAKPPGKQRSCQRDSTAKRARRNPTIAAGGYRVDGIEPVGRTSYGGTK
jgi:hypothetical protein